MEVEEIKFARVGNGRTDPNKIGQKGVGDHNHYPDDEDEGELKMVPGSNGGGGAGGGGGGIGGGEVGGGVNNRLRGWHHSRIIRVSRASGGKDRHSKVWTSKGLRDRRVRLSVATAIQFYDLQDRLGYDQPSKAVEWLIKAAADAIADLPALNSSFPDTPRQPSDERRSSGDTEQGFESAEVEPDGDANFQQQQNQHLSLSKSACSSTSETSKGSGLSLSRSEIRENRVKRRERAKERTAKEKEKANESRIGHHHNVTPISQNSSFTELLTGGISSVSNNAASPTGSAHHFSGGEPNLFQKAARQWPTPPIDYFTTGLLGASSSRTHHTSGFPPQIHLGTSLPQPMSVTPFSVSADNHPELQHFPFVSDHLIPVATSQPGGSGGSDYNLNFTISSGLAAFNRGTLQSNTPPSHLPHLQRFSPIDGSNVPFFIGTVASAAPPVENHHHQFQSGFDARLHLCYGDGSRHSDLKGKPKN